MRYKKIKSIQELTEAWLEGKTLVWNDPYFIEGNDYVITWMEEDLENNMDKDELMPILIRYNDNMSEAQVYLHEILIEKENKQKIT